MSMIDAKLSSKNQIVVPREAREALRARAGDRLLVIVRGDTVILMRKPKDHARAIRGLSAKRHATSYLKKERDSWR